MADRDIILRDNEILAVPRTGERWLIGEIKAWAGFDLPTGFLWCNGESYPSSLAGGYSELAAVIGCIYRPVAETPGTVCVASVAGGSDILTVTSGVAPAVGDVVFCTFANAYFGVTTPTGHDDAFNRPLFVVAVPTSTTFKVSLTEGGAPLTSSGGGSTSVVNEFWLPDLRGRIAAGRDNLGGTAASKLTTTPAGFDKAPTLLGALGGKEDHLLTSAQSGVPAHTHPYADLYAPTAVNIADTGSGTQVKTSATTDTARTTTANTAANAASAHNNVQPTVTVNYIIRYQ